jgi:hypothetical protein
MYLKMNKSGNRYAIKPTADEDVYEFVDTPEKRDRMLYENARYYLDMGWDEAEKAYCTEHWTPEFEAHIKKAILHLEAADNFYRVLYIMLRDEQGEDVAVERLLDEICRVKKLLHYATKLASDY